MKQWYVERLPEVEADMRKLDRAVRNRVFKAVGRVSRNPLPVYEGGYGKPLGRRRGIDLTGMLKIKLRSDGVRVVYKLERREGRMVVVVVGVRTDDEVYRVAYDRRVRHGL